MDGGRGSARPGPLPIFARHLVYFILAGLLLRLRSGQKCLEESGVKRAETWDPCTRPDGKAPAQGLRAESRGTKCPPLRGLQRGDPQGNTERAKSHVRGPSLCRSLALSRPTNSAHEAPMNMSTKRQAVGHSACHHSPTAFCPVLPALGQFMSDPDTSYTIAIGALARHTVMDTVPAGHRCLEARGSWV